MIGGKVRCLKCADVIQSRHLHDPRWCECGAVMVDGSHSYTRVAGEFGDWEWVKDADGKEQRKSDDP